MKQIIFCVILMIVMISCNSYRVVLELKTPDVLVRTVQVSNHQCGCQSVFMDVKEGETETRYRVECMDNSVRKEVRIFDGKILKEQSFYVGIYDGSSNKLTSTDSLLLMKLPEFSEMDFDDCKNIDSLLLSITSFAHESTKQPNEKYKSWFKKNL